MVRHRAIARQRLRVIAGYERTDLESFRSRRVGLGRTRIYEVRECWVLLCLNRFTTAGESAGAATTARSRGSLESFGGDFKKLGCGSAVYTTHAVVA
jgi:hypothetical protein